MSTEANENENETIEQEECEYKLPQVTPGTLRLLTQQAAPEVVNNKDILVNIVLDKDEGISTDKGRYYTWYCFYLLRKNWLADPENQKVLSDTFPVFALADFPEVPIAREYLKPETAEWLYSNWADYYQVIPITNLKGKNFKTLGVHLNKFKRKEVSNYVSEIPEDLVNAYDLPGMSNHILLVSIFGDWFADRNFWYTDADYEKLTYSKKWSAVAGYIQSKLSMLGNMDNSIAAETFLPAGVPPQQPQEVEMQSEAASPRWLAYTSTWSGALQYVSITEDLPNRASNTFAYFTPTEGA